MYRVNVKAFNVDMSISVGTEWIVIESGADPIAAPSLEGFLNNFSQQYNIPREDVDVAFQDLIDLVESAAPHLL